MQPGMRCGRRLAGIFYPQNTKQQVRGFRRDLRDTTKQSRLAGGPLRYYSGTRMKRGSCVFARGSLRGSLCPSLSSWQPTRGFTIASSAVNTTTEPQINFIFPARTGMKRSNTRESMEVCTMASSCRYFLSGRCKARWPFSYAKKNISFLQPLNHLQTLVDVVLLQSKKR